MGGGSEVEQLREQAFAGRWIVPLGTNGRDRLELYELGGTIHLAYYKRLARRRKDGGTEDRFPQMRPTLEEAVRHALADGKSDHDPATVLAYLRATERGRRLP